jgi:hypothetical protein
LGLTDGLLVASDGPNYWPNPRSLNVYAPAPPEFDGKPRICSKIPGFLPEFYGLQATESYTSDWKGFTNSD